MKNKRKIRSNFIGNSRDLMLAAPHTGLLMQIPFQEAIATAETVEAVVAFTH
jgi:hypothetical protein